MSDFNFTDILKNLGGLKGQMEQLRERLSKMSVTGEAGAGMVTATVNGEGRLKDIKIDPALLKAEEKDMLEELIISAVNEASKKAKEAVSHEMRSIAGGLPMAGMEKIFGF